MLRSLLSHWHTAVGLLLFNILAWAGCRVLLLDPRSETLWQDQVVLIQALVLVDTLLVIWWYTDVTATLAKTSAAQVVVSETQVAHAAAAERIRHKPFPVATRAPRENGGYDYVAKNIGSGLAVAVWYVAVGPTGEFQVVCLGALGPGESRTLPEQILRPICDAPEAQPFALFGEALWTRTSQWIATVNSRHGDPGSDIFTRFVEIAEASSPRSLSDVLTANNLKIRETLTAVGSSPENAA